MRLEQNQILLVASHKLPKTMAPFQEVLILHIMEDPLAGTAMVEVRNIHGERQNFTSLELLEGNLRAMHLLEVRQGAEAYCHGKQPTPEWSLSKRLGYAMEKELQMCKEPRSRMEVSDYTCQNY